MGTGMRNPYGSKFSNPAPGSSLSSRCKLLILFSCCFWWVPQQFCTGGLWLQLPGLLLSYPMLRSHSTVGWSSLVRSSAVSWKGPFPFFLAAVQCSWSCSTLDLFSWDQFLCLLSSKATCSVVTGETVPHYSPPWSEEEARGSSGTFPSIDNISPNILNTKVNSPSSLVGLESGNHTPHLHGLPVSQHNQLMWVSPSF